MRANTPAFSLWRLYVSSAKDIGSGLREILQSGKGAGHDDLSG
jgi:hypothetical protein